MIIINNSPLDTNEFNTEGGIEQKIIKTLMSSDKKYFYDSLNQLKFEIRLRTEIINASNELYHSDLSFRVFRDSICNPDYWDRKNDGGFALKPGVKPSDAINDIFINSSKYGTECATAMLIIYYKALLEIFPEDAFNKMFPNIYLMNWHRIENEIREVGLMQKESDFLPGDRRYFSNPDVNPLTPEWQGENVIDLGNGEFYGHGIGKHEANAFIEALNQNRKENSEKAAYLMDSAGRPNFKRLSNLYDKAIS